jgi:nucleotide-binding universal stress UspA family protein
MYRKILVPLDGSDFSEAALAHLPEVAGAETEVILLRVMERTAAPMPAPASTAAEVPTPPALAGADTAGEAPAKAFGDAEGYLEAKADAVRGHVLAARVVVVGDAAPAATIADVARTERVDLIAMATHGRSGVVRWLLGSVADEALRSAQCPLLLIRPGPPTE